MALDEARFQTLANGALDRLMAAVEEALGERAEVDLEGGILTIALAAGGNYVINKHGPMRQVWLSSPVSGAWHFAWDEGAGDWRSTRGAETLAAVLARDLGKATGAPVARG
ncbi:MAG: iron donor protein CyaY [Alphaproteobacteria bacterium]|nr:iron donor protein CyaY [Alphaproteobacteria bacterium]